MQINIMVDIGSHDCILLRGIRCITTTHLGESNIIFLSPLQSLGEKYGFFLKEKACGMQWHLHFLMENTPLALSLINKPLMRHLPPTTIHIRKFGKVLAQIFK